MFETGIERYFTVLTKIKMKGKALCKNSVVTIKLLALRLSFIEDQKIVYLLDEKKHNFGDLHFCESFNGAVLFKKNEIASLGE